MENENKSRASRARSDSPSGNPPRSTMKPATASGRPGGWYVRVQGEDVRTLNSSESPSTDPAEGESIIRIEGPFANEDSANSRADRLRSRMPSFRAQQRERGEA